MRVDGRVGFQKRNAARALFLREFKPKRSRPGPLAQCVHAIGGPCERGRSGTKHDTPCQLAHLTLPAFAH